MTEINEYKIDVIHTLYDQSDLPYSLENLCYLADIAASDFLLFQQTAVILFTH